MQFPLKIKRVLYDPCEALRLPNEPVDAPWEDLEPWVRKMFKAMYAEGNSVGLSACQVGWNVQLFIMNADKDKKPKGERVFWNPKIFGTRGDRVPQTEGCLSLPRVFGKVLRYPGVVLHAEGPHGPVNEYFEGLAGHIVQHEMDHQIGRLCWENFIHDEPKRDPQSAGEPDAAAPPVAR